MIHTKKNTDTLPITQRIECPISHRPEVVTVHLTVRFHHLAAVLCPHAAGVCGNALTCAPQVAARFRSG